MFERGLLPAPFSPRSACTSPAAASKSTPSFATTPGKRFVIPCMATAAPCGAAAARAPSVFSAGLARRGNVRDRPDDALHEPLHRVQVLDPEALALRDHQLP